ncbi:MAG: TraR/DksA family transcriptional regulator [Myxococcales bacterium]|nr:TraR/DksA family transcriptional regulator [Myxococcales bacterium]
MKPDALLRNRAALDGLRRVLRDSGPARFDPNRTDDAGTRDEDHQPLNEMLQAIASGRNRNRSELLRLIDEALHRIDNEPEEYGLCVECEEPIPARRLALMPYAERCVACQGAQESHERAVGGRRNLTDFVE